MQQKGIMFDMDNTLLQSKINFDRMKDDLIRRLVERGYGTLEQFGQFQTPAEVIEQARRLKADGGLPDVEQELWDIVAQHEERGMRDVELEEGAFDLLQRLHTRDVPLTVVTNNAQRSALLALERTSVRDFFTLIVGREQMQALKPSPSGLLAVKQRFNKVGEWVMIGDSWIDGYAAQQGDITFVAYKADAESMEKNGVYPLQYVNHHAELKDWLFARWLSG